MKCRSEMPEPVGLRRSPCGERGLKCPSAGESGCCAVGRSPCGERGLKYKRPKKAYHRLTSLPVRGAWIEIRWTTCTTTTRQSRSPCGERGLKSGGFWKVRPDTPSLPVRGAWIEIAINGTSDYPTDKSLPVRGAWIEMVNNHYLYHRASVAPRAGSVD